MKLLSTRYTKISDLVHTIMNEYIGRFEIPMYNIKLVQITKSLTNLKKHIHKLLQPTTNIPTILLLLLRINITIIK